jgi:hypothetical protein
MSCPERIAKRFQNRMRKVMALEVRGNGPEGTAIPMTPAGTAAQVAKNQRFLLRQTGWR